MLWRIARKKTNIARRRDDIYAHLRSVLTVSELVVHSPQALHAGGFHSGQSVACLSPLQKLLQVLRRDLLIREVAISPVFQMK